MLSDDARRGHGRKDASQTINQPALLIDPDERFDALREFEAILDRTAEMQKEDMWSYHRFLKWSERLNETVPLKRAQKLAYQQLVNDPAKYRGVLVRLQAAFRFVVLGVSPLPEVIRGRDGWLFYADDGGLDDYLSATPLTQADLEGNRYVSAYRNV